MNHRLSAEERSLIMCDFQSASLHLLSVLQLKSAHWHLLPWRFAGLGHPDPTLARVCGSDCLRMYDHDPISEDDVLHPRSILRRDVLCFLDGAPLARLPALFTRVVELKLIPVVERVIEMRHSVVSSSLGGKRRKHPTTVSLANRALEFDRRLEQDPFFRAHGCQLHSRQQCQESVLDLSL